MRKTKSYVIDLFNEGRYGYKGHSRTQNADFWTSDTDAWLRFKIATQSVVISSAQINLYNKNDKSLVVEEDMTIVNNEAEFKMSEALIEHFGHWAVQVIFIINGKEHTSPTVEFRVLRELGADLPEKLGIISDWKDLDNELREFIAEVEKFTAEDFVELKMGEKLQNLEVDYATRLTGLTAQLTQKASKVEVESKIGDLGAVATFKGSATNATILVKTDMAVGDEWYDTTNQRSLRWNGSAWVDVGSTIKLGDESITTPKYAKKSLSPDKTTFIDELPTLNVFDKRGMTDGKRVFASNGTIGNLSGYSVNEDLRAIKPATTFTRLKNGELAFYDSAGVFISGVDSGTKTFTTPTNASSYRIACLTSDLDTQMMVEDTTLPTGYIPNYINKLNDSIRVDSVISDTLADALWNCLGDSTTNTTYGIPYHQHIKDRTGIVPMNYGVNGTSIAVRAGQTNSLLERYPSMNTDADIITVLGGRNDISWAVPVGVMTDRVDNTLYGACHLLFKGLIEKYPSKKIGVMLPLQRSTDTTSAINYINAIREVAEYYSLPVLDLYRHSGLTPRVQSIVDAYMPDGLHPNSEGHEIISRVIEAWLRTL